MCKEVKKSISGSVNNCNIEDICNSLKNNNKDLWVNIYRIINEYIKGNKQKEN